VTLVDLAKRKVLTVNDAGVDGDWLVSILGGTVSEQQQSQLLGHERGNDCLTD
jgi:hypothetical protein